MKFRGRLQGVAQSDEGGQGRGRAGRVSALLKTFYERFTCRGSWIMEAVRGNWSMALPTQRASEKATKRGWVKAARGGVIKAFGAK